ncbi:MAG: leucine-rich repeat domain-containing protein [Simkaniaceae bacterium]|nr:leucine-rich repeat domain-containing protein [Simkaniaceae bacterium]
MRHSLSSSDTVPPLTGRVHFLDFLENQPLTREECLKYLKNLLNEHESLYLSELLKQIQDGNQTEVDILSRDFGPIYPQEPPLTLPLTETQIDTAIINNVLQSWVEEAPLFVDRSHAKSEILEFIQAPDTALWLTELTIADLPEIFHFPSLQKITHLDLTETHLTSLPDSIKYLSALKKLILIENREVTTIPETLKNLTNLETLRVRCCGLRRFPEAVEHLPKLKKLDLYSNKLQSVPDFIGNLSTLKLLNLSHNELREFPTPIKALTHIEGLSLSLNYNPFTGNFLIENWTQFLQDQGDLLKTFIALRKALVLSHLEGIVKKNSSFRYTAPYPVVLAYLSKLKEKLKDLPDFSIECTEKTLFSLDISDEAISDAETSIRTLLSNEEALHATLLLEKYSVWKRTLELHYPDRCRMIEEQIAQAAESFDPSEEIKAKGILLHLSRESLQHPPLPLPLDIVTQLETILNLSAKSQIGMVLDAIKGDWQSKIITEYNLRRVAELTDALPFQKTSTHIIIDPLLLADITKAFSMPPLAGAGGWSHK